MKNLVLNIGLLLLALFGAISCNIKEDMSNCPGRMILDYSAYSDVILDQIDANEQIDVFIFDADGICVDTRTFTYGELKAQGMEFQLPIIYRNYNAVVWQGLNSERYDSSSMALGEHYEDFHLKLLRDADDTYTGVPESLWATQLEPIEYCAKITRHRVYMRRLHTEITVTLQERLSDGSVVDLDMDDYTVNVKSKNDIYQTDYTISPESSNTIFLSDGDQVGTLRLTPDMECVLSVDGVDRKIDLVEYMLKAKLDDKMSDQEFLDLNKVWDVKLIVKENSDGYVAIGINVNGWVVWFNSSGLS